MLTFNMMYLQSNQCHNLAQKLMKEYPDIDTPVLIEAAQYVKDKDTTKAIDVLKVSTVNLQECVYRQMHALAEIFNYRLGGHICL